MQVPVTMKLDDMDVRDPSPPHGKPAPAAPYGAARPSAPDPQRPPRTRGWVWLLILCVLGGVSYLVYSRIRYAQSQTAAAATRGGPRSFPVVAAVARRGDMPIYLNGLGTVTAFETVTVRSRVDGELIRVHFKEGQLVKQGDLLAEIDPRPYQVQLTQVEGQLARDNAQFLNAQADLQRFLSIQQSITPQQIDAQRALVAQMQGAVKTDQGQIDNVKLQLAYCRIISPLYGRAGLRLVDEGNMIHPNDPQGLVVITQLQPIAVNFFLREDDIAQVLRRLAAGEQLQVDALDRDANRVIATGTLLASDNQVDASTGTLRFKAVFPNEDGALFPNQFVNARLRLTALENVVIVPAAAVQRGPQSTFVYVVQRNAPATRPAAAAPPADAPGGRGGATAGGPTSQPQEYPVELRNVVVGHQEGDEAVIESGIQPGDVVVTDGVDKLQSGTKVTYRLQRPPAPAAAATTQPRVRGAATTRPTGTNRTGARGGRRGEE